MFDVGDLGVVEIDPFLLLKEADNLSPFDVSNGNFKDQVELLFVMWKNCILKPVCTSYLAYENFLPWLPSSSFARFEIVPRAKSSQGVCVVHSKVSLA